LLHEFYSLSSSERILKICSALAKLRLVKPCAFFWDTVTINFTVVGEALQTFPGQSLSRTDVSRTRRFPDKSFPGQDVSRTRPFPDNHFPGQVILRNFHVHSVCKYPLYRLSHTMCKYTESLLMCACRPAVSIRGLFGKACIVQQWVKRKLCYY